MSEYCRDDFGLVEQADDDFKMWQGLVGPHYTPSVSEDGTLSWSNDGQLPNPEDVNIKGPPGEGEPGPGVPAGGTTGQLLAKASDEDYDGEWIDPPEMDAGQVSYDSAEAYDDGTVGKELTTINSALTSLSAVTEIIDTASGAIASFPDGSGLPMRSLVAQINPVQDLHGYDEPWAGGAGANKLRTPYTDGASKTGSNVTYTVNSAGQITIACSASASGNLDYYLFGGAGSTYESTGLESGTYTFAVFVPSATTGLQMFAFNEDGTSLCGKNVGSGASQTFSIDGTKKYRMFLRVQSGNTVNTVASPIIVSSSTAPTAWTPYSNECPISGWTGLSGKDYGGSDLLDGITFLTGYYWNTSGNKSSSDNMQYEEELIPVEANTTYALAFTSPNTSNKARIQDYNSSGTFISLLLEESPVIGSNLFFFTTSSTASYIHVSMNKNATNLSVVKANAITCTWQSEAGTVYDGYIDVVSGELVATHGIADLSTFTWSATSWGGWRGNVVSDMKLFSPDENANLVAEKYKSASRTSMQSIPSSISAGLSNDPKRLFVNATDSPTGMCVYPLAEPIVYQLTPQQISTLLGNNTVFVDCGSVSVTYQASIKGYIDKVLGA